MSKYGHIPPNRTDALLNKMGGDVGMNGEEAMNAYLRNEIRLVRVALSDRINPVARAVKKVLTELVEVIVVTNFMINPTDILKTTKATDTTEALWVDSNFAKILALVDGPASAQVVLKPRLLTETARDREIKAELPCDHDIPPMVFVWMLATELDKVMRGEHSNVLSKNHWSLFYVAGVVVSVFRIDVSREWRVITWKADFNQWHAELAIFSYY